jgi:hypothetical protein
MTDDEFRDCYSPVWERIKSLPGYSNKENHKAEQLLDKLLGWKEEGFLQVDNDLPLTENQKHMLRMLGSSVHLETLIKAYLAKMEG